MERIYAAIDVEFTEAARALMRHWLAADAHPDRPPHRYSIEQFGLTAETIREAFADRLERLSEPREPA
jgi:hypothetical protein